MSMKVQVPTESPYDLSDIPDSLAELTDFLEQVEHPWLRDRIRHIGELINEGLEPPGGRYSDVLDVIQDRVERVRGELLDHLLKEEKELFPLARSIIERAPSQDVGAGCVSEMLAPFRHDHENALENIQRMRRTTGDFFVPQDAGDALRVVYQQLDEFHRRLERHVWIEENLLAPGIRNNQRNIREENQYVRKLWM